MITTPTAKELSTQILADFEGAFGQSVPILPKAFLRALATVLGGALALLYRFLRWTYDQLFAATADEDALIRQGQEYGLFMRQATSSIIEMQIVGDSGALIPSGTIWTGNNGLAYTQRGDALIADTGLATGIRLECLVSGSSGSLGVGNRLAVASPVGGVIGASCTAIIVEGEDAETVEEFRARVIQRKAGQPQGGSAADYVGWAMEVPGVVKAFAFRTATGTVTVYPLEDTSGDARIPVASKIAEVLEYVSNPARRPLCATTLVAAMTERTVDISITSLTPNDATTRSAIESAVRDYLYAAYPKQYPDEPNPTNVVSVAAIWSAILYAGASAASVVMTVSGAGTVTSYGLGDGEICKLGTITWA